MGAEAGGDLGGIEGGWVGGYGVGGRHEFYWSGQGGGWRFECERRADSRVRSPGVR
jgi:hypothetical protein